MKRVEKNLGNTLIPPPPPPPRCISLIQSFLETANIFLPIFFEVQFIIKPHDVSRCVWLFDVINNAILRNVFISVFKHSVFLVFDAIWLGHYLRLLSNTHLLLWSENVENRNKKTGVNSLFRSKNLTNKRRGCTWKYKIYKKKSKSMGNTALGNCFCLENLSTEKLLTCILQQIVGMWMVINVTLISWQLSAK